MEVHLQTNNLSRSFGRRAIFAGLSISLDSGESLAITGRNGTGKSTLLKILAGVLAPSKGTFTLNIAGNEILPIDRHNHIGFVAPYLQMYDEFTAMENLDIFRKVRGLQLSNDVLVSLLERFNIGKRRHDLVRTYSSGMKQRLKYAFALLHRPPVLFLDEPRSNLDVEGISTAYEIMEEQKQHGILIIATNDQEDLVHCEQRIDLDSLVVQRKEVVGKQ